MIPLPQARLVIAFDRNIGDTVRILPIDRPGRCVGVRQLTTGGPEYYVSYWYEGSQKLEWIYAADLQAVSSQQAV